MLDIELLGRADCYIRVHNCFFSIYSAKTCNSIIAYKAIIVSTDVATVVIMIS